MSYCRFSDGDVYMFGGEDYDGNPALECCACQFTGVASYQIHPNDPDYDLMLEQAEALGRPFTRGEPYEAGAARASLHFETPKEALEHLLEHQEAGHEVPETALERLRAEIRGEDYVYPLSQEEVREELLWFCQTYAVIPFPKPLEAEREWNPEIDGYHMHSAELEEDLIDFFKDHPEAWARIVEKRRKP
jgi:hypothetical protein